MRPIVLAFAATALVASGCGNPCQDLGERLCECAPAGVTKAACVDGVKTQIRQFNPGKSTEDVCSEKLRTCWARKNPETGEDISFCDWLDGRCGKAACGISEESYANLSGYESDGTTPITPNPDDPTKPLCPK